MVEHETKVDLGKEVLKKPDADHKAAGSRAAEIWNVSHGSRQHEHDVAEIKKEGKLTSAEAIEKEAKSREDAQFRKGLTELNGQLHESGQLPKDINIVGFDTKGRLLAKDSNQGEGQHMYVIAPDTGQVVAKSEIKDGKMHWETGKGYLNAQDRPDASFPLGERKFDVRGNIAHPNSVVMSEKVDNMTRQVTYEKSSTNPDVMTAQVAYYDNDGKKIQPPPSRKEDEELKGKQFKVVTNPLDTHPWVKVTEVGDPAKGVPDKTRGYSDDGKVYDIPPDKAPTPGAPDATPKAYDAHGAISNLKKDGENISEVDLKNGMKIDGKTVDGKQAYNLHRPGAPDEAVSNLKVNEQDGSMTFQDSLGHSHKVDNQGKEHEWWEEKKGSTTFLHTRDGGPQGAVRNFSKAYSNGTYYVEIGADNYPKGYYWADVNASGSTYLKMTQIEDNLRNAKTGGERVDW